MRVTGVLLIIALAAGIALAARFPTVRMDVRGPAVMAPVPTPQPQIPAHLLFVGDIQLSRAVGDALARRGDWIWPFARVASVTRGADVSFANLESVVASGGTTSGCTYCFRADPRVVRGLTAAGFDVLSVANNHAWDYGPGAFAESLAHLRMAGIAAVGGGRNLAQAREPLVLHAGTTSVAYLAYTDLLPDSACATDGRAGVNCADAGRMAEDITRARSLADVVIVSFHTGTEYELRHDARQERIYHAAIDAGADLVIGHHPHVIEDIERYRNGIIFYSLGNFIFDQAWSLPTMRGMLVDISVSGGTIRDVATRSVDISPEYQASLH